MRNMVISLAACTLLGAAAYGTRLIRPPRPQTRHTRRRRDPEGRQRSCRHRLYLGSR